MGTTHLSGLQVAGVPTMGTGVLPLGNTYFYVDSVNGNNGNPGTFDSPFAGLETAINACTANSGCIIVIKAGHTETITSATSILFDVAGIEIVGLGNGANRPTFTFTTANTARIPVSAANIKISNCIFIGNFLSIATCFLLTTAPNFWVDNCAFRDTSATLGFLSIITTTVSVNSDGLTVTNNTVQSDATTSPGPMIVIANTLDRLTVTGNYVVHTVASNNVAALIAHGALVVTHAMIAWNYIYSINTDTATGGILLTTSATTGSGMIMHNRIRALDVAAAILVTATAVQYGMFDNLYIGETTQASGFVLPAIGTDA